jgi:hypothetical protein
MDGSGTLTASVLKTLATLDFCLMILCSVMYNHRAEWH